jgi:hypothetical protein
VCLWGSVHCILLCTVLTKISHVYCIVTKKYFSCMFMKKYRFPLSIVWRNSAAPYRCIYGTSLSPVYLWRVSSPCIYEESAYFLNVFRPTYLLLPDITTCCLIFILVFSIGFYILLRLWLTACDSSFVPDLNSMFFSKVFFIDFVKPSLQIIT